MKVAFHTLGCKVNQYESQSMLEQFLKAGFCAANKGETPDVFVVNSCTVTAESNRKTRQTVHRAKNKYPNCTVVLTGCMPQAFKNDAELIAWADIIVGNTNNADLPALVNEFLKTGNRIVKVQPHLKGELYNTAPITNFSGHTRAFMKIEDGCERYCTYCIIPFSRGFVRSRRCAEIKAEAVSLANAGYSEIVLVGINLTAFGKDTGENLCDAVEAAASPAEIKRVRLGSLEPDRISDEIIERLSRCEKFCPQFHLALQSGCDATLKRMNRHYTTEFYFDLLTRIKAKFKNPSFTTDVMVGFPGETEQDFAESTEFIKKAGFAKCHVFAYSRRAGTVADTFQNQIENSVKEQRSQIMIAAAKESEKEFLNGMQGQIHEVLFEECNGGVYSGFTKNYIRVQVESKTDLRGKTAKVKIVSNNGEICMGTI